MKYNINDDIVIYPSDAGWAKLRELIQAAYRLDDESCSRWIDQRRTSDNGYKEQAWSIISDLHKMFFNGTPYFKTMVIDLTETKISKTACKKKAKPLK